MTRAALALVVGAALLAVAPGAVAAGWTAPVVIPTGAGGAAISHPAVRANATGVLVARWQRGRVVYAGARFFGGPWARVQAIARARDATAPAFVTRGATVGLAMASEPAGAVRVARWSGSLVPAIDGPRGGAPAGEVRLTVLPNHEVVTLFRRSGSVMWSARSPRRPWTSPRVLFRDGTGGSVATDASGAVLATAVRHTAGGDVIVAALRSPGEIFGPSSTTRVLGPRGSVTSVASAFRQDGRTGLVVGTRSGLVALPAGARQRPVPITPAGTTLAGRTPAAIALRPSAGLVAVWREVEGGRLRLRSSQEDDTGGGSWETPISLSPPTRSLGAPVVESAPAGRTILAYALDGRVYTRILGVDAASGWSAARLVSGANTACASPTVTFDTARKAIVAFTCGGGRRLLMVTER